MSTSIPMDQVPALGEWLKAATKGIDVIPMDRGDWFRPKEWWVELHNDVEGDDHAGTIIARCTSEQEAELVAAALWRLARE